MLDDALSARKLADVEHRTELAAARDLEVARNAELHAAIRDFLERMLRAGNPGCEPLVETITEHKNVGLIFANYQEVSHDRVAGHGWVSYWGFRETPQPSRGRGSNYVAIGTDGRIYRGGDDSSERSSARNFHWTASPSAVIHGESHEAWLDLMARWLIAAGAD